MLSNFKVHIVSHTHWDREWYFSTSDSLVLLDQTFTDIINELNSNPNVNFCLDGQISIVKEYLKIHPEKYQEIKKLVKEKRLFVGPWQTQTDTQLVSLQSIVNNLYYGIHDTLELFDDYMKVGYLPDTFGFSNQLPMILNQFEIDNIVFWRGIDYHKQGITPYFRWIGQDNSEVAGINLPKGYGMAKGLKPTKQFQENILDPIVDQYNELLDSKDVLIPVGNDQNNIVVDLDKKIKQLNGHLVISDYETFIKTIKTQLKGSYKGEFRQGKHSRIHKSAGSIRYAIKKSNYNAEIQLSKVSEPLNVMAKLLGLGVSHRLTDEAWRLLFEGQAHDGIVGCVNDSVAEDILVRNKHALEISKSSENFIKKQVAHSLDLKDNEIIIFNTDAHPFDGYKEIEIISHSEYVTLDDVESCEIIDTQKHLGYHNALVETPEGVYYEKEKDYYIHKLLVKIHLPSFGYKVFTFHECEDNSLKSVQEFSISNKYYKITFNNGMINLKNEEMNIDNFISLCDEGNDGDTYDFSPLKNDKELILKMNNAKVYKGKEVQKMIIDCTTSLPYSLEDRLNKAKEIECSCILTLELRNENMIYVKVDFENKVLCHRLRLKINNYTVSDKIKAATPGGTVLRDILKNDIPDDWQKSFVEYPIDIETNSGFVSYINNNKSMTVFNKGLKEYQAKEKTLYMTLFASCDELGKPDLLYRPGRASGDTTKRGHIRMKTPLAQELGNHHFEIAITFDENNDDKLYKFLNQYETPSVYYQSQNINLFYERIDNKIQLLDRNKVSLNKEVSLMSISDKLHIYNIYQSLYNDKCMIRFMSFEDFTKKDLELSFNGRISNLLEKNDFEEIKAYRLYTLGGIENEN